MKKISALPLTLSLLAICGAQIARADDAQTIETGKRLFQNCVACHQATGQGVPGAFPPLAGSAWATGNDERLIRILLHGVTGKISIKQADYNGNMPAFGQGLGFNWTDAKVAAVATYVRQAWGNAAPAVATEKVTAIRTKEKRTSPWTSAELEALK